MTNRSRPQPLVRRGARVLGACLLTGLLAACVHRVPARVDAIPGKRVEGTRGMVAASHPDAAAAGRAMLQRGGNAVDAAVATAFALSVVDPSQTGLGGGGSATLWMRRDRRAASTDFMAASGADSMWSVLPPASQERGGIRGRAAAVPGTVAGLLQLLERHGTLSREVVMAPAIALARDGFSVSPLLSRTITSSAAKLGGDSLALARFMPGGEALQPGDRLMQPELAATLELIARGGAPAFYEGDVARRLAAKVTAAGGLITERDMREYRVIDRRPLCGQVMGHTVLTAPPTLSGMTVLEALGIFERAVRAREGTLAESPAAAVALVDALRIADADRARWRGDPGAAPVPARGIASAAFAAERAALVGSAMDTVPAGDPWDEDGQAPTPACAALDPFPASMRPVVGNGDAGATESESFTSHLSVVDADRNAVSMTFTVGVLFGSGVYTDGFFLNSAGTNFDSRTAAPNRRNNSTMSPTILLDRDLDVRLVVGAAGSAYIPPAVVQTIVQVAHYGRDVGDALAAPRLSPQRRREVEIEPGWSPAVYAALRAAGFATRNRIADLAFGGVHAVQVRSDGRLVGAADPRRDGAAAGY